MNKRTIRKIHLYNLNTRIVLIMTAILLVTGTVAIVVFRMESCFCGNDGYREMGAGLL